MCHVDALSRKQAATAIETLDIDYQLQIAQSRDNDIQLLKTKLESGPVQGYILKESRGINHVLTATASPQANGQVERVNRVLRPMLSKETDPQRDLTFIRSKAHENIIQSQIINEEQFAKKHRPAVKFQLGDLVMIRNLDTSVNVNKKLIARFKGPYVVHKCLPNDRYVIRDIDGAQQTQIPYDGVLESDKLRKWMSQDADSASVCT
ncbi:uncharacterized protein LOC126560694 [Anopheles maculipalpis]|uniref:uncharacterized protein LOC126560694 n=1 Tax=Anopheles maculipalpis TaxID=1496333 RepID=UPI002159A0AD|nr:uncharacterized protein LOC126560694 [Anopheles maculipalpis]